MTQAAQAALRRVIEQYTRNVRFCIICNYVNKITPAIQSRCTRFRFSPLPMAEVEKRIQTVIETEGYVISVRCPPSYGLIYLFSVKLTDDGKEALLKLSRGDMRRALNILQACHAAYPVTDEEAVYNCTGNPHPKDIDSVVASMMTEEFGTCYQSMILPCMFIPVDSLSLTSD
jgi:replication factor C subunit 3/5